MHSSTDMQPKPQHALGWSGQSPQCKSSRETWKNEFSKTLTALEQRRREEKVKVSVSSFAKLLETRMVPQSIYIYTFKLFVCEPPPQKNPCQKPFIVFLELQHYPPLSVCHVKSPMNPIKVWKPQNSLLFALGRQQQQQQKKKVDQQMAHLLLRDKSAKANAPSTGFFAARHKKDKERPDTCYHLYHPPPPWLQQHV